MPLPIAKKLQWAGVQPPHTRRNTPLWKGPEEDGVTFSLLSRFLVCRERFRLLVVEGLACQDQFNHRLRYGDMWHVCEEALAGGYPWEKALLTLAQNLARRYPTQQNEVDKWYNVCRLQFPLYVAYWKKHPDVMRRTPVLAEYPFAVRCKLPSGRHVLLRGKWDSVDFIGAEKKAAGAGVYLQENKTKGDVNEQQIKRQLTFDFQTMIYLTALHEYRMTPGTEWPVLTTKQGSITSSERAPILGVRYNVVRRPLSGGKGTIVQGKGTAGTKCATCKGTGLIGAGHNKLRCGKCGGEGRKGGTPPESREAYYARVAKYIEEEPETFFFRWKVEISPEEVARFRRECLYPILEQLCDWWQYISDVARYRREGNPHCSYFDAAEVSTAPDGRKVSGHIHWRHPFGVYNVLDEGGSTDVDEYLATGSEAGLERIGNLFPELT